MQVNPIRMEEMLSYGYCPLQYRYRFILGLPWFPASPETAMSVVTRGAFSRFFQHHLTRVGSRHAEKDAVHVLEKGVNQVRESFPTNEAVISRISLESLLSLRSMSQEFVRGRDVAIGPNIPYDFSFKMGTSDQAYAVRGSLDAAYWRSDNTPLAAVVIVTLSSSSDPLEDMPRWAEVRTGFAYSALRQGINTSRQYPIHQLVFPLKGEQRITKCPSGVVWAFKSAVVQTVSAIKAKYFMPTANRPRCRHCPYDSICSIRHSRKKPHNLKELEEEVLSNAEGNSFVQR